MHVTSELGEIVEIAEFHAGDKRNPLLPSESRYGGLRIACVADQHKLTLACYSHARATLALA